MSRDIKFRAWCKKHKYMYDICSLQFIGYKVGANDNKSCLGDEVIMQYTGLKDKNCNEIYEGDIVEIGDFTYSIKFEIGSFMLVRCSNETDMYAEFDNCWNDDVYPLCQLHWESNADEDILYNCEVIGNIYKNPELLDA